ncbi:pyridoxamine 5'-phosphate oxidase family protein [Pseudooceanicola sp. C21-150M6]|uniref:pyridoxamine 5'-phosphate oxidase family protein n=1 Tax=Pseudooceanicola sp. C21-150M6 TaxID=3434355 RepID=UPI003D7FE1F6
MKDYVTDLNKVFWDRAEGVHVAMLDIDGRAMPMAPYADKGEGLIWFITAEGTEAHKAAQGAGRARLVVSDGSAKLHADISGSLTVADNADKLDELWSPVAAAWFEDGREDEDVRLLAFRPTEAEVWATDGGAGFLYQIAKANLTDSTPDAGDHGKVRF